MFINQSFIYCKYIYLSFFMSKISPRISTSYDKENHWRMNSGCE